MKQKITRRVGEEITILISINDSVQSDSGGNKFLLEDNWTTFVKARLNCSLPGTYPFYFSELQSTYYSETDQLIYAVFTTSPSVLLATFSFDFFTESNVFLPVHVSVSFETTAPQFANEF
jgi:hypothetical protein